MKNNKIDIQVCNHGKIDGTANGTTYSIDVYAEGKEIMTGEFLVHLDSDISDEFYVVMKRLYQIINHKS